MLQPLFQIKGKGGLSSRGISFPLLSYLPVFPVSVLLSFALSVLLVMLKMHILYLKMQTQDHFWSRTYSEVVSLTVLLYVSERSTYLLKINCDLSSKSRFSLSPHIKNIVFPCRLFLFCYVFWLPCRTPVKLDCWRSCWICRRTW